MTEYQNNVWYAWDGTESPVDPDVRVQTSPGSASIPAGDLNWVRVSRFRIVAPADDPVRVMDFVPRHERPNQKADRLINFAVNAIIIAVLSLLVLVTMWLAVGAATFTDPTGGGF